MLRNYIKVAVRNLVKHRLFSVINIAGLSVSVMFCLLLFMHIRKEQSFDGFHAKKEVLYRLEMTDIWPNPDAKPKTHLFSFLTKEDDVKNGLVFPLVVANDLKMAFPEVEAIVPAKDEGPKFVKWNRETFKEKNVLYAGEHFFQSFSFRLIKGNPKTALSDRKNIVLSEHIARKYFGEENPMGKTIEFAGYDSALFQVSGVVADAPLNSSYQYDMILPVTASSGYDDNIREGFNHMTHPLIVELKPGTDARQFEAKMNVWVKSYFTDPFFKEYGKYMKDAKPADVRWSLRKLTDCHYNVSDPWGHYTNARNIYQLSSLVIIILLIASLNYILLAVSSGAARTQEVGVRKVMGAQRKSLVLQFWIETQVIVIVAVVLGLVMAELMIPVFNSMIGSVIQPSDFFTWQMLLAGLFLCLLLGLFAGYYPALVLSKMKPVSIMKSFQTFKVNPRFSRWLVVMQYSACIVLMMAALVIGRQMNYISHKDLGFDKEQVILIENENYDIDQTKRTREQLRQVAETDPIFSGYSVMTGGLSGGGNRNGFRLHGEQKWLRQMDVDYDYFKILNIPLVKGRLFSREMASDTSTKIRPCVVNETLFNLLGNEARMNEYNEIIRGTIIGVVKDYHIESLASRIEPQQHMLTMGGVYYFMFKVKPGKMQQAIARLEKEWKRLSPVFPFEYTFLDESIAKMYEGEARWQKIIQASCGFAIIIACMGLFGLAAVSTANRRKEIGIRKVLGANVSTVVGTLSKQFVVMVLIAFVIAAPLSWWIMSKWLEDFQYRVQLSWWMFALVGVAALLVALLTVGVQTVRAALANPVKSLRSE